MQPIETTEDDFKRAIRLFGPYKKQQEDHGNTYINKKSVKHPEFFYREDGMVYVYKPMSMELICEFETKGKYFFSYSCHIKIAIDILNSLPQNYKDIMRDSMVDDILYGLENIKDMQVVIDFTK